MIDRRIYIIRVWMLLAACMVVALAEPLVGMTGIAMLGMSINIQCLPNIENCCPSTCPACSAGGTTADQMQAVIAGWSSGSCADCDDLNATYILDAISVAGEHTCQWYYEFPSRICNLDEILMRVETASGDTFVNVEMLRNDDLAFAAFRKVHTGVTEIDCRFNNEAIPKFSANINCVDNSTCHLTAV